jgi:titin
LNDVSYTGITTLGADVTGFTNSGLSAGITYFYKIEAFNAGGTSALSGATSTVTLPAGTTPSAPTGFTALSATDNSVTLQWIDISTNEDGFLIYYRGIT